MSSYNRIILMGNLGKDPEIHDSKDIPITKISIATERYVKSKQTTVTDWHNITLFGQAAKFTNANLRKGDSVLIEGELQTSEWVDGDGKKNYSISIVAHEVQAVNLKSKTKKQDDESGTF